MYCSQESDSSIYAAARTESVLLIAHFTKDVKNLLREGGTCDERLSRKANDISDQVERTCSGEGRTFRIGTGSLSLLSSHQLLHDLCLMLYGFRQIDEYRSTTDANTIRANSGGQVGDEVQKIRAHGVSPTGPSGSMLGDASGSLIAG